MMDAAKPAELTHAECAKLIACAKQYRDFILRARRESELVEINGEFKILVPYWFMKDDGIEVYDG